MSNLEYPATQEEECPTLHPTMLHVIEPDEAETYFTHGARELQYDSYSDSYYLSVPYQGRYVIRQDFGKNQGKGKRRNRNFFEKFLMGYYRCLWSLVSIPSIIGVSRGDSEPCFIIYNYDSLVLLHNAMRLTQSTFKELPNDLRVTGESMWRSMSQRHHVTLDKELMIDVEVKFFPEAEARIWDLWSTLRLRLDEAMGKAQQQWNDGLTSI